MKIVSGKALVSTEELDRSQAAWAALLRDLRLGRKMELEEVSQRAGICAKGIDKIEKGISHPKQETLVRLCRVYGVPFSVAAMLVELRLEGIVVPVRRVFRVWRAIRRFFARLGAC